MPTAVPQELMVQYSDDEIVSLIHNDFNGQKIILLAPIVRSRRDIIANCFLQF